MNQILAKKIAISGAKYLLNQIKDNGKFIYFRDGKGDEVNGQYNILRHAGAIWAIQQVLGEKFAFDIYPNKLEMVVKYLESKYRHTELGEIWLEDKGISKLGGNALAYLATKNEYIIPAIKQMVNKDGSIIASKVYMHNGLTSDWVSEYYPGEAALALAKAGEFDLSFKIVENLYRGRDIDKPLQDHWLMQAIEVLWDNADKSYNISMVLLKNYMEKITMEIILNPLDYINRACPLACRLEGLASSYKVLGDPLTLDIITSYLNRLARFQYVTSHTSNIYGAFWDKGGYRIDYTQHAICAFNSFSNIKL